MRSATDPAADLPLQPRAPIERPLSAFEYYHASVGIDRVRAAPRAVTLVIEGEGADFEPDRWREALAVASAANPGSRLRLVGGWWRARWTNDGRPPDLRFMERCDWDGLSQAGAEFIDAEPLSLQAGRTAELILINRSPRGRLIVFRFLHAVMDGRGALHFLADLFRALRGDPPAGSNAGFSDADMMRRLGPGKAKSELVFTRRLTGRPRGKVPGYQWRRVFLDTDGRNILARVAAIKAAYFHRHSDLPALISVPVDVRARMPGLFATTNFCNALLVRLDKGEGADIFRRRLQAMIDNRMDLYCPRMLGLLKVFPLRLLDRLVSGRQGDYRGRGAVDTAMISNLGRLDSSEFSCGGFRPSRLFIVPPFNSQVYSLLVGMDDRVELVLGMPNVLAGDGRFDDFVGFLHDRLAETESGGGAPERLADRAVTVPVH
ncbi:MAG: hypothetical protein ABTQ31_13540 [Rhizobiaceae bacterium]